MTTKHKATVPKPAALKKAAKRIPSGVGDSRLLVTVPEAATMLSMSESILRRLIRTNEIESLKIGHSRRVPVAELHAWIARGRAH